MSPIIEPRPVQPRSERADVPPLENGDHLDQKTFHQRYLAMPDDFKAELIQGRVYVPSPVRRTHGRPHALITGWLVQYDVATEGVEALVDSTAILDEWNEPQPDCFLILKPELGGRTHLEGDYFVGPPELAIEIAASIEAYDLYEKRQVYEQTGIQEYVIVVMRSQQVLWLRLHEGRYVDHPCSEDGVFRSKEFPGLWLNATALFAENGPQLLATLREGLESDEHRTFYEELKRRRQ